MKKALLFFILASISLLIGIFAQQVYSYVQELRKSNSSAAYHNAGAGFTQARLSPPVADLGGQARSTSLAVPVDAPNIGSLNPLLQIQVFCDFQCPYCGKAFPIIREFVTKYADRVQLVFRHFPNEEAHPDSGRAAVAAECAKAQGKFWPFYDKLFVNQDRLDPVSILGYAQNVGLDAPAFTICVQDPERRLRVEQDLAEALRLGVRGTPTWFINGKKVEGVLPVNIWEEVLRKVAR